MKLAKLEELARIASDRASSIFSALGFEAFAWPIAIGSGLGLGLFEVLRGASAKGTGSRGTGLVLWPWEPVLVTAGIVVVVVAALGPALLRRRAGDRSRLGDRYLVSLRRGAFLSAAPLVLALRGRLEVEAEWVVLAFAAISAGLFAYSTYHFTSDRESRPRPLLSLAPVALVVLAMLGYSLSVGWLAIRNHLSFNTGRSDLGYYVSIFRQSSQGIPLGCSLCGGGSHLTGHFDPILVLLSPLYLIYPFADTLLVLQTVWLASGAVPVYLLTLHHVQSRGAAAALAVAYLAYPALHGVNLFDFHSLALAVPLLVWLFYFLECKRTAAYFVMVVLVLLVREDMPLALLGVAAFAIFSRVPGQARLGWITAALAVLYFVVTKTMLMGRLDPLNTGNGKGGYAYYYEQLIPARASSKALLATLVSDPLFSLGTILTEAKLDYVSKLLVPVFALPLFTRGRMLLVYGSALTLLATRPHLYSVHFQYSSALIPFVFVLTSHALGGVRAGKLGIASISGPRLSRALSAGILVSSVLASWKFGAIVENGSFEGGFRPINRHPTDDQIAGDRWLRKVSRSLPRGAKVAASSRILTHLGSVTSIYLLDERQHCDYVVATIKQTIGGHSILSEEGKGFLQPVEVFGGLRLYRANYKNAPIDARTKSTEED